MFSIVIRNKNESFYLNQVLTILNNLYNNDYDEIILVDNNSTDDSVELAKQYGCKIVTINNFTYGKALNLGIKNAKNNHVLLLSSHAIPVGTSFFKNTKIFLNSESNIAGLRYINSYSNYKRSFENGFLIKDPLQYGLMAACCIVVKEVWEKHKFNENLPFSEDKEWSFRVSNDGYKIYDVNETFYYFIERNKNSELNRFRNETLAAYYLGVNEVPTAHKIMIDFFKRLFYLNPKIYFSNNITDFKKAMIKLKLQKDYSKVGKYYE